MLKHSKTALFFLLALSFSSILSAQSWQQLSSIPMPGRNHPVMFSIGNQGYSLTGGWWSSDSAEVYKDFYRYDAAQDQWTQMPDFPGTSRNYAVGTAINGKGYIGFGETRDNVFTKFKDLWEYDPTTEIWTQKASCPCQARTHPAYTVVNGKLYIGLGENWPVEFKDWWVYDPALDSWAQLPDFPGIGRHHPMAFTIGDTAYVGFGHTQSTTWAVHKDLYGYDVTNNTWSQKSNIPNGGRVAGLGFSAFGKGYIIAGYDSTHSGFLDEFWEYDGNSDSWTAMPSFAGEGRWAPGGFMLGNDFYMGAGKSPTQEENDFWKYEFLSVAVSPPQSSPFTFGPNPADQVVKMELQEPASLRLLDVVGKTLWKADLVAGLSSVETGTLPPGVYFIEITQDHQKEVRRLVIQH